MTTMTMLAVIPIGLSLIFLLYGIAVDEEFWVAFSLMSITLTSLLFIILVGLFQKSSTVTTQDVVAVSRQDNGKPALNVSVSENGGIDSQTIDLSNVTLKVVSDKKMKLKTETKQEGFDDSTSYTLYLQKEKIDQLLLISETAKNK